MKMITRDAIARNGSTRHYEVELDRPRKPIIEHERHDSIESCDADETKTLDLDKKAIDLLNELVAKGVTADDIIAVCKPLSNKEDKDEDEEDLDEEETGEIETETEESGDTDEDFGGEEVEEKEEVKSIGDSIKPTNSLKSVGATIRTTQKDSLSEEIDEINAWKNR